MAKLLIEERATVKRVKNEEGENVYTVEINVGL